MSASTSSTPVDEVAALIADFTVQAPRTLDPRTARAAKAVLIDSVAVAMGALAHPAAQAARRHAYRFSCGADGCVIWGSAQRTMPDLAALTNGVLLRCYDYNDFFVGARNSGHASDMVSGVVAAAEWANVAGAKLLAALAIGYEVVGACYDAFSTAPGGWLMARLALAAQNAADPDFAAAKLATARFYAEHYLARAPSYLPAIQGGATILGFDPDLL